MAASGTPDLMETFHSKYNEFASELIETFPELTVELQAAKAIPKSERQAAYTESVFKGSKNLSAGVCPGTVLPGVELTASLWESVGSKTKTAIFEYVSLMNLCIAFSSGGADSTFTKEWAEKMMNNARAAMSGLDFENLSQTFFKAFGKDGMPPLPERFLKGKLAKLAEDMVREFKPEDFGLKPEEMEECERNPQKAFEILMTASMSNPQTIQNAMGRIAKKLQEKVARGELRPQELVAEAEELIKEFKSHPAFVELMETFRNAFSFDDMDTARAAGRDSQGRLAQVRARLKKKLEERKKNK
jgi:hypothetical protein